MLYYQALLRKPVKLITMIEMFIYTLVGIILYFASDWILLQMEKAAGRQFENRSLIYFVIILFLALTSFTVIRLIP